MPNSFFTFSTRALRRMIAAIRTYESVRGPTAVQGVAAALLTAKVHWLQRTLLLCRPLHSIVIRGIDSRSMHVKDHVYLPTSAINRALAWRALEAEHLTLPSQANALARLRTALDALPRPLSGVDQNARRAIAELCNAVPLGSDVTFASAYGPSADNINFAGKVLRFSEHIALWLTETCSGEERQSDCVEYLGGEFSCSSFVVFT